MYVKMLEYRPPMLNITSNDQELWPRLVAAQLRYSLRLTDTVSTTPDEWPQSEEALLSCGDTTVTCYGPNGYDQYLQGRWPQHASRVFGRGIMDSRELRRLVAGGSNYQVTMDLVPFPDDLVGRSLVYGYDRVYDELMAYHPGYGSFARNPEWLNRWGPAMGTQERVMAWTLTSERRLRG
jgi:hypothetical protein